MGVVSDGDTPPIDTGKIQSEAFKAGFYRAWQLYDIALKDTGIYRFPPSSDKIAEYCEEWREGR